MLVQFCRLLEFYRLAVPNQCNSTAWPIRLKLKVTGKTTSLTCTFRVVEGVEEPEPDEAVDAV